MKQQVVDRARGVVEAVLGKPYAGAALDVPPWFPDEMRKFGQTFAVQQSKRHFADYDPDHATRTAKRFARRETAVDLY